MGVAGILNVRGGMQLFLFCMHARTAWRPVVGQGRLLLHGLHKQSSGAPRQLRGTALGGCMLGGSWGASMRTCTCTGQIAEIAGAVGHSIVQSTDVTAAVSAAAVAAAGKLPMLLQWKQRSKRVRPSEASGLSPLALARCPASAWKETAKMKTLALLALLVVGATAEVYFKETFDGECSKALPGLVRADHSQAAPSSFKQRKEGNDVLIAAPGPGLATRNFWRM